MLVEGEHAVKRDSKNLRVVQGWDDDAIDIDIKLRSYFRTPSSVSVMNINDE